jgi:SAM-dependent MidA family methyltransferase
MTPAAEVIAAEIERSGPISFYRFMELALYHPQCGYYRRARDPFGKEGDFFTAEQIQPVFGILIAARVRQLFETMGHPADFTVVELGAGRREMAEAFRQWRYIPVDVGEGDMPSRFRGVVFANEFFDALPVHAAVYEGGEFRERLVAISAGRFAWETGGPCTPEVERYLRSYYPAPEDGRAYEANLDSIAWLERIAGALEAGYALTIDYGYTRAEWIRFPAGTLISYRRHTAGEDVLEEPGERDITAHVNFSALEEAGAEQGLRKHRFETLAQLILAAGEADQFAAALGKGTETEQLRRRMQLKTLLFGMGETFRVLLQHKVGRK